MFCVASSNVELKSIKEILIKNSLPIPELEICSSPTNIADILHWQPGGPITWNGRDYLGCSEPIHIEKARALIRLAIYEKPSLLITAEYSFPFAVLREILGDQELWPDMGKLWILCMEGISRSELFEFCNNCSSNVFVEKSSIDTSTVKHYYCTLFYVFRINQDTIGLIAQAKTSNASDRANEYESINMCCGKYRYLVDLHNNTMCNKVITFLCADILKGEVFQYLNEDAGNILILQPQLNPKPFHASFGVIRESFLQYAESFRFLSLNWATGTTLLDTKNKKIFNIKNTYSAFFKNREKLNWKIISPNHKEDIFYDQVKGFDDAPIGEAWCFPEEEHCSLYVVKSYQPKVYDQASNKHYEPTARYSYFFRENEWRRRNICSIDFSWLADYLFICKGCDNDSDCSIEIADRFICSFFGETVESDSEFTDRIFLSEKVKSMSDKTLLKREKIQNVVQTIKSGNIPKVFEGVLTKGKWGFSGDSNINDSDLTKGERYNRCLVTYCDFHDSNMLQRHVAKIKANFNISTLDHTIVYYPDHNGLKVYDKFHNIDVSNPSLIGADIGDVG